MSNNFFNKFGLVEETCVKMVDSLRYSVTQMVDHGTGANNILVMVEKYISILDGEIFRNSPYGSFSMAHCLLQKGYVMMATGKPQSSYIKILKSAIPFYKKAMSFFKDYPVPMKDVNLSFRRDFSMVHFNIIESYYNTNDYNNLISFAPNALKSIYEYSGRYVELEAKMVTYLDEALHQTIWKNKDGANESCVLRIKNLLQCVGRIKKSVPTRHHNALYIRAEESNMVLRILSYIFQIGDSKTFSKLLPYFFNLNENLHVDIRLDQINDARDKKNLTSMLRRDRFQMFTLGMYNSLVVLGKRTEGLKILDLLENSMSVVDEEYDHSSKSVFKWDKYRKLIEHVKTKQEMKTTLDEIARSFDMYIPTRMYNPENDSGLCCYHCHKKTKKSVKKCGRCRIARYCSLEHQKSDWKNHKKYCIDWMECLNIS